jgi:NAD+ synthase (glutamine-hydrolysing)
VRSGHRFFNLYSHDFVRVALATPRVRVADPTYNTEQTLALIEEAAGRKALLVAFPELGLSGYSCEDLFHQSALLAGCVDGLHDIVEASRAIPICIVVGLPLRVGDALYNCAAVVHRGRILGVIPKTYLPNYREFYEGRQFTSGDAADRDTIMVAGQRDVPFTNALLFQHDDQPLLRFHVEICEDLWVPLPPSSYAALAGATVLVNLSASNITIGKAEFRRELAGSQSARCIAAYLYTAAGAGESTTDLAWDGHAMIYENGTRIAESRRFAYEPQLTCGDIDLDRLVQDRLRQNSFAVARRHHASAVARFRTIGFSEGLPADDRLLIERVIERFPYVPAETPARDRRCEEVYQIQVQGLATRLRAAALERVVVGVSGGLDSAQALIVAARAMDVLELPRTNVLAYSLPGFATSERTRRQALDLMKAVGATAAEIDIRPSSRQMLEDIGHPWARGEQSYDVTFENVQAGERTSHLFRLANQAGALVVGSSDLSELALGWCTYGVGDHMAHYHVNASVPKTLVQYLLRWVADTDQLGTAVSSVVREILATEISPELVPGDPPAGSDGGPAQRTEAMVGPYELQDFNLYYTLRFGHPPTKVAFLSYCAWRDRSHGPWPEIAEDQRNEYDIAEIKRWLAVFVKRFFESSQFKRSCIANSPKVGSGGSLSPRGDYRAPSDGSAEVWLADLARIPDEE